MRIRRPKSPGTLRITVAGTLAIVVGAALRRWDEEPDRWWILGGVFVLVAMLAWWRGLYLTTIVGRRLALFSRNRGWRRQRAQPLDVLITSALRIETEVAEELPLAVIASYLDRYGIRCKSIRVTSRSPHQTTWVSVTVGAADNLTALKARSPQMPLYETGAVVRRRLADHLRELGWVVEPADPVERTETPLPGEGIRERWRGVHSEVGYTAAYRVVVAESLPDTFAPLRETRAQTTWTVVEFSTDRGRSGVSAVCALETADRPDGKPLAAGVTPEAGRHRPVLAAMDPFSTELMER